MEFDRFVLSIRALYKINAFISSERHCIITPTIRKSCNRLLLNSCGASGEKNNTFKSSRDRPQGDKIVPVYTQNKYEHKRNIGTQSSPSIYRQHALLIVKLNGHVARNTASISLKTGCREIRSCPCEKVVIFHYNTSMSDDGRRKPAISIECRISIFNVLRHFHNRQPK